MSDVRHCPECAKLLKKVAMVKVDSLRERQQYECKFGYGGCGWSGWFTADGKHTTPPAKESNPK